MTDTRLEAAARAAAEERQRQESDAGLPPVKMTLHIDELVARAAVLAFLKAAREPSEGMRQATFVGRCPIMGERTYTMEQISYGVESWQASVDKLRKEIE